MVEGWGGGGEKSSRCGDPRPNEAKAEEKKGQRVSHFASFYEMKTNKTQHTSMQRHCTYEL